VCRLNSALSSLLPSVKIKRIFPPRGFPPLPGERDGVRGNLQANRSKSFTSWIPVLPVAPSADPLVLGAGTPRAAPVVFVIAGGKATAHTERQRGAQVKPPLESSHSCFAAAIPLPGGFTARNSIPWVDGELSKPVSPAGAHCANPAASISARKSFPGKAPPCQPAQAATLAPVSRQGAETAAWSAR
jgi:hypothetical protein